MMCSYFTEGFYGISRMVHRRDVSFQYCGLLLVAAGVGVSISKLVSFHRLLFQGI